MAIKIEILDAALVALRQGETLTLDSVVRHAGRTKPGIVHHFNTTEVLTVAVVERLMSSWELDFALLSDARSNSRVSVAHELIDGTARP